MTANPVLNYTSIDSPVVYHHGRAVSVGELLFTVDYLADKLPPHLHLLNLYEDRYHFLLGFLLGIKLRTISLFPSTVTSHVLSQLQVSYDDILVLAYNEDMPREFQQCNLAELLATSDFYSRFLPQKLSLPAMEQSISAILPAVEWHQEIAIIFTSGSTGQPKPYSKQWGDLVTVAHFLAEKFLFDQDNRLPGAVLATVPAQHMYGLESSILMALQNGLLIHSDKPFFPQDITNCLEDIANLANTTRQTITTTLITTPLHLKACIKTQVALPGVRQFISATAPLDKELAQLCENRYSARVMEIFGCTEVGSMAWRRTIASEQWQVLDDISLSVRPGDTGDVCINTSRSIKHFLFNDIIDLIDERHFILKGRKEDLINLAGKRTSLAYLNHHLQSYDGLLDGCFYQEDTLPESRLVAFVVLDPELQARAAYSQAFRKQTIATIKNYLKNKIEAVFLPKTIFFVSALPRNATGKLPFSELRKLMNLQGKNSMPSTELSFSRSLLIDNKHPSLADHFPGNPIVPGVVILDRVLQLWMQRTNKNVRHINHAKFVHALLPDNQCTIDYHAKDNQKVDFLIRDQAQTIIAKGLFSYVR